MSISGSCATRRTTPPDLTEKLKGLGFEVFGGTDLDRRALVQALIQFGRARKRPRSRCSSMPGTGCR